MAVPVQSNFCKVRDFKSTMYSLNLRWHGTLQILVERLKRKKKHCHELTMYFGVQSGLNQTFQFPGTSNTCASKVCLSGATHEHLLWARCSGKSFWIWWLQICMLGHMSLFCTLGNRPQVQKGLLLNHLPSQLRAKSFYGALLPDTGSPRCTLLRIIWCKTLEWCL